MIKSLNLPIEVPADAESVPNIVHLRFDRYRDICRQLGFDPYAEDTPYRLLVKLAPGFRVKRVKKGGRPRSLNHAQRVKLNLLMEEGKVKKIAYEKTSYALLSDEDFAGMNPTTLRRIFCRDRKSYKDPVLGIVKEFLNMASVSLRDRKAKPAFFREVYE